MKLEELLKNCNHEVKTISHLTPKNSRRILALAEAAMNYIDKKSVNVNDQSEAWRELERVKLLITGE